MKELIQGINWKFVLVAVLVAALISWLFIFDGISRLKGMFAININNDNSSSNNSTNSNTNVSSSSSSSSSSATAYGQQGFPLHMGTGSKQNPSAEVKELQQTANYYLKQDIATDGVWGPDTERAMAKLHDTRCVMKNGKVGVAQFSQCIDTTGNGISVSDNGFARLRTYHRTYGTLPANKDII